MTEKRKKEITRIKELESINLATEDIRDLVVQTKMEVEKDNEFLAKQNNEELKKFKALTDDEKIDFHYEKVKAEGHLKNLFHLVEATK